MKRGWMENFMGGYGSKDRYELANTLNRFRENSQLTIIGNLNNTNNQDSRNYRMNLPVQQAISVAGWD